MAVSQAASKAGATGEPQWQNVDQLCGQLELATPTKRTIVVNGKRKENSYVTYVKDADVVLYRGTHSDKVCCDSSERLARSRSRQFGAFEFSGFEPGLYWLQLKKGSLKGAIPLRVTDKFNARACRAPEIGRSFVVDSDPPVVQVRVR